VISVWLFVLHYMKRGVMPNPFGVRVIPTIYN
jgi:hypothetical protein